MKLREWYEQEVVRKKMCVECMEVCHIKNMGCPMCTCSVFYFLSRLVEAEKVDRIINESASSSRPSQIW